MFCSTDFLLSICVCVSPRCTGPLLKSSQSVSESKKFRAGERERDRSAVSKCCHLLGLCSFGCRYMKYRCGIGGMIQSYNEITRKEPVPMPLCPPQIPQALACHRIWTSVVIDWQLTSWDTERFSFLRVFTVMVWMTALEHTVLEYLFQKRVRCVCVCVGFMYDEGSVYNYFITFITPELHLVAMWGMCGAVQPVSHISSRRRA